MTQLLIRLFVPNSSDTANQTVREAYGVLGGLVGIVCNCLLFVAKLGLGLLTGSVSIMADAVNNLSDAGSSIVALIGAKVANQPPDEKHPFGHGRVEYISGLIVAFVILFIGVQLCSQAVQKIFAPTEFAAGLVPVIILSLTVLVKLWLFLFHKKIGQRIQSSALSASSFDALGDVLSTGAVILSMIVTMLWQVNIDATIGLLVALFVLFTGFQVARETLSLLLGESVDPKLAAEIERRLEKYPQIIGSHDLIVHNYGPGRSMASIHAEVPDNLTIREVHEIIDNAEKEVAKDLGLMLVIHMDPVPLYDKRLALVQYMVDSILAKIDKDISQHDLRVFDEDETLCVEFDLLLPYTYSASQAKQIAQTVEEQLQPAEGRIKCSIHMDRSFIKR